MMKRRRRTAAMIGAALAAGLAMLPGCTSGLPRVEDASGKDFILAGVDAVNEIAQLTGPGAINDTASVGVAGTDLGSMVTVGERTFFFFGDTFGERDPQSTGGQGGMWRSNVSAWTTDDDPSDGITFDGWAPLDGIGLAVALIEGEHAPNDGSGEVTKIPTHGFAIGDTLYMSYMSVTKWGEPGQWDAGYSALARSTDGGASWMPLESARWPGDSPFVQFAAAHVEDGGEPFVYLWAIPSGRLGSLHLMRVPAEVAAVEDFDAYTYFAGTDGEGEPRWVEEMDAAQPVLDGTIGEMSVIWSTYLERWLLTYSSDGNMYVREGLAPWGPWGEPIEAIALSDYPGLYGPYMEPRYVEDDGKRVYFTLSLWGPYNVFWFSLDLVRG